MRNWNQVLEKNGRSLPWAARKWLKYENKLSDRMMKLLLNSVIAKYHDLSVSRRSIICLGLRLRQIIDLLELTTDNSRYFAQPRPIIVNYSCHSWEPGWYHEKVLWCGTLLFTLLFTSLWRLLFTTMQVIVFFRLEFQSPSASLKLTEVVLDTV